MSTTKPEEITYNETLPDATEADAKEVAEDAKKEEKEDQPTGNETSDEIRTEIEETRAELIETIGALQDKLDPNRIKDRAIGATVGKVQELAHSAQEKIGPTAEKVSKTAKEKIPEFIEQVRNKPIVAAGIAGAGVVLAVAGWFVSRNRSHRYNF